MPRWLWTGALALAVALWGCDDTNPDPGQMGSDGGPGGAAGAGGVGGEGGGTGGAGAAGGQGGAGGVAGQGGVGGQGGEGGAGGEAGQGGQGGVGGGIDREIRDCLDLCGVYRGCDRADLWGDDLDECATFCAEARDWPEYAGWRDCLRTAACDDLQACVPPEAPPPTCGEVCATIAGCGPGDWPGVDPADCPTTCADGEAAARMVTCAQAADLAPGACNTVAFSRCSYEILAPDCVAACDARAACGQPIDAVACVTACAGPLDGAARNRKRELDACVTGAADCDGLAACDAARAPLAGTARICAADRGCGQFPAEDCEAVVDPILRQLAPGAVECFEAKLPDCGFDVLQCFRPAPDRNTVEACAQGCADRAACGQLFVLEDEQDCRDQCEAAVTGVAPGELDKFTQTAYCAGRATCAEFAECLQGAEARVLCNVACQGQADCLGRIDDIQGCIDDCRSHWNGERMQAFAACHFVGGDCAAVDRCFSVPDNDCAVLCEAFEGCEGAPVDCEGWCDGQRWLDPYWYPTMVACAWGAEACADRVACLQDTAPANACVAWCTGSGCQGGATVFGECAHDCGRYGVGSYGGVAFRQIEGCLAELGADATCQVLQDQCPLPRLSDAYCPQVCEAVAACDVAAGDQCVGECAQRWEDEAFINAASNALRAQSRGEGCPALLEAWGAR